MRALFVGAVLLLASAPAAAERITTPEGWYEIEEGFGESKDGEVAIVVSQEAPETDRAAEKAQEEPAPPPPSVGPSPVEEVAAAQRINCDQVRGLYLRRVMELHGMTTLELIDPELLSVLTRERPPTGYGFFNLGGLGDPALSLLYGEPPVPPGALGFDFKLQQLAPQVIQCLAQQRQGSAAAGADRQSR